MERRRARLCRRRRGAAAEPAPALTVGDRAAERRRRPARARCARRRIGGQLAQPARVVSAVRSAAPHARLRRSGSDGPPADLPRCPRARRTASARADLLRPERVPEGRGAARADRHRAPWRGGRRRSCERHVPQHVLRARRGLREAAAVRQGDHDAEAGTHLVADRSARRNQARTLSGGLGQGRRRCQDAAGRGDQVSQGAGGEAVARLHARARAEVRRRGERSSGR